MCEWQNYIADRKFRYDTKQREIDTHVSDDCDFNWPRLSRATIVISIGRDYHETAFEKFYASLMDISIQLICQ